MKHELSSYGFTRSASGWNVYNQSGKFVGAIINGEFMTAGELRKMGIR